MCAIAGIAGVSRAAEQAARMARVQAHRGPDGGGVLELQPDTAFAHRRLAILDLSTRGAQPMTSRDGRWSIVFNGELFNYRELQRKLPAIPWRSGTDTEVLLEAVATWGLERALAASIGMFAFALWDAHEHSLFIARDRLGEKPLVYFHDGRTFAFASELKALAPLHGGRLDPDAVDLYLALGYIPAPRAIFRNTHKLPAGHYARLRDGALDIRRWWFPEDTQAPPADTTEDRRTQLRELLADAVRLRLRSDVPVALALSGGIDSSVLAAELARQGARPLTFTVAFEQDSPDAPHAASVARHFDLPHTVVNAPLESAHEGLAAALAQYDEPFADSSSVACLALARALAPHARVILNGDGGDEAFGGYRHYEFISAKQTLKAAAAAAGWRDGFATSTTYVQSKTLFRQTERQALLDGATSRALDELLLSDPYLRQPRTTPLKKALWSDRHLHLANGLTFKTDIAFSAFGLESRAPLLDHRILEFAQQLPDRDLVRGHQKKILLREAYRDELPPEILRRPKQGFGAPIRQWIAGPLRDEIQASLPCPFFPTQAQSGLSGQRLWTIFTFARWAQHWSATW